MKLSKADKQLLREQAKEMIQQANIKIFAAEVMLKHLGKK